MARGTYRRAHGVSAWHFCTNCSNWPTKLYDKAHGATHMPADTDYCNECLSNEQNGSCASSA